MATKCPKCEFENPADTHFCGKCATPLAGPQEMAISKTMTIQQTPKYISKGSVLAGKYHLLEELGKGGMGRVYRAFDKKVNEEIASKLIKPEAAARAKWISPYLQT